MKRIIMLLLMATMAFSWVNATTSMEGEKISDICRIMTLWKSRFVDSKIKTV